ncbi:MAG: cytochrome c3 family protein [Actinomycetota bacterium]|nr:cytochrome c3 family protein [Actinomycetota bacterium]
MRFFATPLAVLMGWDRLRRWRGGAVLVIIFVWLFSASPAAGFTDPHDSYSDATNLCQQCHKVHLALEPTLIFKQLTEKEVCYACHDGSGSNYNVKTGAGGFGESTLGSSTRVSYHPVPNTDLELEDPKHAMTCTDCHTPHKSKATRAKLLSAGGLDGGDAFCGYCHGATANWYSQTLPGGDHITYMGPPHSTGITYTPSGAQTPIKCLACHGYHGEDIRPLVRTAVKNNAGNTMTVTAGSDNFSNNSLCEACHSSSISSSAWYGFALYTKTKHFAGGTRALNTWTKGAYNNEYQTGYCLNCHNPHGTNYSKSLATSYTSAFTDYQGDYLNQLCYDCHTDALIPASGYSYRGSNTYTNSSHGSYTGLGNTWPTSTDTGSGVGTGGAATRQCINCHNPHGRDDGSGTNTPFKYLTLKWEVGANSAEEGLCYGGNTATKTSGCHSLGYDYSNSGTGTFYGSYSNWCIFDLFNPATLREATANASNAKINQRHDIGLYDQGTYNSGAKIECDHCHNPHINNNDYNFSTKSRMANPDNTTRNFTTQYSKTNTYNYGGTNYSYQSGTDSDPAFGKSLPDFVAFCLACHEGANNSLPGGVSFGTAGETANIGSLYFVSPPDQHGTADSDSTTGGSLKSPYSSPPYAALNCTDCHDPHGSGGLYHLKSSITINSTVLTTDGGNTEYIVVNKNYGNTGTAGSFTNSWCSFCHNVASHKSGNTNCGDCHYHGATEGMGKSASF